MTTTPERAKKAATYAPDAANRLADVLLQRIAFNVYSTDDDPVREAAAMLRRFAALRLPSQDSPTVGEASGGAAGQDGREAIDKAFRAYVEWVVHATRKHPMKADDQRHANKLVADVRAALARSDSARVEADDGRKDTTVASETRCACARQYDPDQFDHEAQCPTTASGGGEREAIKATILRVGIGGGSTFTMEDRDEMAGEWADAIATTLAQPATMQHKQIATGAPSEIYVAQPATREDEAETINFVAKWVERGLFDKHVSAKDALEVIAHYPSMPFKTGRWDVDHKDYAKAFYAKFPRAALSDSAKATVEDEA